MKLAARFLALLLTLVSGATLTVAGLLGVRMLEERYRHLAGDAHALGLVLANLAGPALQAGDRDGLRRCLEVLAGQPGLAYAAVYDTAGRLVVRAGPAPAHLEGHPAPLPPWWQALRAGTPHLPLRRPLYRPLPADPWHVAGYVEVGLSLAAYRREAAGTLRDLAVPTAAVILLTALVGWWWSRRLGRPLETLARTVAAVPPEGDGATIAAPGGPREVRALAEAFARHQARLRDCRARERRTRAELEAQVAQRTESLRQMIAHAHTFAREARAASRAKSRFLANVSHELRTPLNAILGFMELLAAGELHGDQRHYVRLAREAAQALLQLIEDLLDFARIEAGRLALREQPFDLVALVTAAVELHRPQARAKGLYLRCRHPGDLAAWRRGDAGRIRQVLNNLLHNAVKFTEWGGIEVRLMEIDAGRVAIEVHDTGIGLTAEDRERIFEPFTQVDDTATRRYGGTGLGLSICRQLVEFMGGTIEVTSQLHRGSCFRVTLPLPVAAAAAAEAGTVEAPAARFRGRVLVVEDDRLNRALLTEMLKHLGCEADAAADADALWQRWRRNDYDLVLMDCQLPGVDGFELARELRRRHPGDGVPIVAVTADVSAGIRDRCRDAGMDDCLHKPVTLESLAGCLGRWLRAGDATPAAAEPGHGSADTLFDTAVLAQLQRLEVNQSGLLERLFALFRLQGQQWLQSLEGAVQRGDREAVRQVAHGFRSACVHLGIRDLVALLTALEAAGELPGPQRLAWLWAGYRRVCCLFGTLAATDGRRRV